MVLDTALSDGAKVTAGVLGVLGGSAGKMTQEEIARVRGVNVSTYRRHLRELDRSKVSGSISIIKRDTWRPWKRFGEQALAEELAADRVQLKLLSWKERCAREGGDP